MGLCCLKNVPIHELKAPLLFRLFVVVTHFVSGFARWIGRPHNSVGVIYELLWVPVRECSLPTAMAGRGLEFTVHALERSGGYFKKVPKIVS